MILQKLSFYKKTVLIFMKKKIKAKRVNQI